VTEKYDIPNKKYYIGTVFLYRAPKYRIIDVLFFFCSEDVFLLLLNIEDNFMLVGFALVIISGQSKQKCRLLRFKKKS